MGRSKEMEIRNQSTSFQPKRLHKLFYMNSFSLWLKHNNCHLSSLLITLTNYLQCADCPKGAKIVRSCK